MCRTDDCCKMIKLLTTQLWHLLNFLPLAISFLKWSDYYICCPGIVKILVFRKEALNEHYWKTINQKFNSCLRHMTNSLICRDDLMKLKSLLLTFLFNRVLWTEFYQVTKEFLRITLSSVDNLTLNYHKWTKNIYVIINHKMMQKILCAISLWAKTLVNCCSKGNP